MLWRLLRPTSGTGRPLKLVSPSVTCAPVDSPTNPRSPGLGALVIPLITLVYLAVTALNEVSITTGREVVGTPIFVFLLLVSLLLVLVLVVVQVCWGSSQLRQLAVQSASRLGPEPWLSLVSIGVGLAAAVAGGIILQLEPDIAAPHWLIGTVMTLWFGFECMIVLLVRAIDIEGVSQPTRKVEQRPVSRLRGAGG
jgi:hypothetical protein